MKAIGTNSNVSSSKTESDQDRSIDENQGVKEGEIVEVPVADTADAMSVENSTTVNVRVFIINDYHRAVLFVRIEQVDDLEIPLRDASLSQGISPRDSFRVYCLDYSHGKLSVTFYPAEGSEIVTTPSTSGITVGRQVLKIGEKVLLLDERHRMEAMRQLHVERNVG